jgi:hypothetical protein
MERRLPPRSLTPPELIRSKCTEENAQHGNDGHASAAPSRPHTHVTLQSCLKRFDDSGIPVTQSYLG